MRIKIVVACVLLLPALIVGGYFLANEIMRVRKESDAREKLAYQSLTDRLPKGKPIAPTKALDAEAVTRWEELDRRIASSQQFRANELKALHEKTRKFFVESPGAGSDRGFSITDEDILLDDWAGDTTQPGEPADFPLSAGEPLTRLESVNEFLSYHESCLWAFFYPPGFGYVKNRDQVAGFRPHGFRSNGSVRVDESKRWQIQHVQLVGILSHERPVVYLTKKMPSMEQVRKGTTRTLDFFEQVALPSLSEGEDLFVVRKEDTLRMLGAVRATKTCQKCHDAEIGDLLGAFSYTLRRAKTEKKASDEGP